MQSMLVFGSGLLFGLGLILSGMSNPANVIGFLDIAGGWNLSLAFVMVGAIPVAMIGMRACGAYGKTIFGDSLHLPGTRHITMPLVVGSFLFGAGWAVSGFCPGPALVALGTGNPKAAVFVLAMIVGMLIHDHLPRHRAGHGTHAPTTAASAP